MKIRKEPEGSISSGLRDPAEKYITVIRHSERRADFMLIRKKNLEIIGRDGAVIPAIFTGGSDRRAVLIAHGICGDKNEWYDTSARIAERLEEKGIACLRIDFRGHGDSREPLSSFTPSTQLADMESAFSWLQEKGVGEIIPLGISFGGPGALRLAAAHFGEIRTCMLIAPVTDYRRNILTPDTNWGKETFAAIPDGSGGVCYRLSDTYFLGNALIRELRELDIPAIFERISEQNRRDPEGRKQRILIFHGERDPKIAFDGSFDLARKYPGTVGLTALPDTVHGLTQTGDETFSAPQTMKNLEAVIAALVSGADPEI